MGLGEEQDGGVANEGREEGSGERAAHARAGRSLDEREKGKAKFLNMSLRDVLLLGDSPWREVVAHRERDTAGQGL